MEIKTEYVGGVLATYQWMAYVDGEEGLTGYGVDEVDALIDLAEKLADIALARK